MSGAEGPLRIAVTGGSIGGLCAGLALRGAGFDVQIYERISGPMDEWTPIFDYDPARAIKSRKAILDRVATDRVMVMGYHFPFPGIGHVVRHDLAYRWE